MSKPTLEQLQKENAKLREALTQYADRENWGYYDDSGCPKGYGHYTDVCFIGPEIAEEALINNTERKG